MIAFVGPSGGGKTTLFALLERYYDIMSRLPEKSKSRIHPYTICPLQPWRIKSAMYLMKVQSIRENLTYGLPYAEKISDDRLWKVTKMAYADGFIKEFQKGLQPRSVSGGLSFPVV